jgi:hypothetical protein
MDTHQLNHSFVWYFFLFLTLGCCGLLHPLFPPSSTSSSVVIHFISFHFIIFRLFHFVKAPYHSTAEVLSSCQAYHGGLCSGIVSDFVVVPDGTLFFFNEE